MPSDRKIAKLLGTQSTPHPTKAAFQRHFHDEYPPQLPVLSVFRPDDDRNMNGESMLSSSRDECNASLRQLADRFPLPQSAASAERTAAYVGQTTLSPSAFSNTFKSARQGLDVPNENGSAADNRSVRVRRKRDIGRLDGRERSHSNAAASISTRSHHDHGMPYDREHISSTYSPAFAKHDSQPSTDHFHRHHAATFDTETSSLAFGSEHSSRSTHSHRTNDSSSLADPYAIIASSYGRQVKTKASRTQSLRRHASELTPAVELPSFPSNRSILMLGMITQDFEVKIDTGAGGHRRLLQRRKEWSTRSIMLASNARQAQGQLSSKLATLTGADTIGESTFFFDTCLAEQAFASLHLFKTHVDDTREDDRLHITSSSYVAVAETTNNDQAQWGLRIAGLPGGVHTSNKSRAAEATQVEWTLRFDSKFRMLDWQTTLRALIIALTEAESEFRTGLKSKRSVASLGGASSCNSPLSSQWSPTFPQQRFGNLTQQMYEGSSDSETSDDDHDDLSSRKAIDNYVSTPLTSISEPNILKSLAVTPLNSVAEPVITAIKSPEHSPQSHITEFGMKDDISRSKTTSSFSKSTTGSSRLRYSIRGSEGMCPPPLPPPMEAIPPAPIEATTSRDDAAAFADEIDDQIHALSMTDRYSSSARSSMTTATDRSGMSKQRGSTHGKMDVGKAIPDVPESVAANTDFRWSAVLTKHGVMGDTTVTSFLDSASSADSAYDEEGGSGVRSNVRTKPVARSASLARQAFESLTFDSKSEHARVDSPIEPAEYASGSISTSKRTTVSSIKDDRRPSSSASYNNNNTEDAFTPSPPVKTSQNLQAAISTLQASCHSKEEADALLQAARELARRYRARNETAVKGTGGV